MTTTVTKNDIIAEIQKALDGLPQAEGPRGITIKELAEAMKTNRQRAGDLANKLRMQGRLTVVRLIRYNQFGQPYHPWGFQLVAKKK